MFSFDATVAGDEVGVEQFVVILGVAVARVCQADRDVAIGDLADRHRLMGDVGEEGMGGADGTDDRRIDRRGEVALDTTISSAVLGMPSTPMPVMSCGKPFGPGMKLP